VIAHGIRKLLNINPNHTTVPKCTERNQEHNTFSYEEKVTSARAIASVYLNCLSLRQSDTVFIKTLIASIEILKVFGIELFLAAVGEPFNIG
jgi:hypothetical protein